jgi:hypothetical protein
MIKQNKIIGALIISLGIALIISTAYLFIDAPSHYENVKCYDGFHHEILNSSCLKVEYDSEIIQGISPFAIFLVLSAFSMIACGLGWFLTEQ